MDFSGDYQCVAIIDYELFYDMEYKYERYCRPAMFTDLCVYVFSYLCRLPCVCSHFPRERRVGRLSLNVT